MLKTITSQPKQVEYGNSKPAKSDINELLKILKRLGRLMVVGVHHTTSKALQHTTEEITLHERLYSTSACSTKFHVEATGTSNN